jgi:diaminopimelate decarboxylase
LGGTATTAPDVICPPGLAAGIWPRSARLESDDEISVAGVRLSTLAARYGTPAYIIDEADVRYRCQTYSAAFPYAEIAYAGKAFLCRAMAEWIAEEGLSLDVCSAGELAVARSVSFPAGRIVLHGNAKTPGDLRAAVDDGVGRIVIDSASEIIRLAALARPRQRVLIRVTPGVDAHTHQAVATGVEDQKFGFSLSSGAAADAVRRVLTHPELEFVGLHSHLGSQITHLSAFEVAARRLIGLMADVRERHGLALAELNLGGGHAVPYVAGDEDFNLTEFADRISRVVRDECASLRLPVPRLTFEPGRAIVNRAAVTLYRVLAVKHVTEARTFIAVDGGMSDNPRPALYGARYSVRAVRPSQAPMQPVTVVGRHCEAGDVLACGAAAVGRAHRPGLHLRGIAAVDAGAVPGVDPARRRSAVRHARAARGRAHQGRSAPGSRTAGAQRRAARPAETRTSRTLRTPRTLRPSVPERSARRSGRTPAGCPASLNQAIFDGRRDHPGLISSPQNTASHSSRRPREGTA